MARLVGRDPEELERVADQYEELVDDAIDRTIRGAAGSLGRIVVADASAAAASADDLNGIPAYWAMLVDELLLPDLLAAYLGGAESLAAGLREVFDLELPTTLTTAAESWVAGSRNRLTGIVDELWMYVREELVLGIRNGESIDDLAKRVREAAQLSKPRAKVTARTEVVSASNAGSLETVRALGFVGIKEWLTTHDSRTRPTHVSAGGQRVDLSAPFQVGATYLDFPGDPSGPADEVINCRCSMAFDVEEVENSPASDTITASTVAQVEEDSMPWHVVEDSADCPDSSPWAVVKDEDGSVEGCHDSLEEAQAQLAALYANEVDEVDAVVVAGRNTAAWEGVLVVEGTPTGDGRQFAAGSLSWADLPIPLRWQKEDSHGGMQVNGVVNIGRIDEITRSGNELRGRGVIDLDSADGREAHRRMGTREDPGFLAGVSIDADDPEDPAGNDIEFVYPEDCDLDEDGAVEIDFDAELDDLDGSCLWPELMIMHSGRIRAATMVDLPAFVEAQLYLVGDTVAGETGTDGEAPIVPLEAEMETITVADTVEAITAAAHTIVIPDLPEPEWFNEPVDMPTSGALTVTDEGRVYGYLAPKNVAHRAFKDRRVEVPMGKVDYSRWMNRETIVQGGDRLQTGPITMDCGHAAPLAWVDAQQSTDHYDNSCSIVASVRVGENEHGVWVAGALMADVQPHQVARMLACQLSGDWRPHRERSGYHELTGALLVPVPGFPMTTSRQSLRVRDGALVAACVPVRYRATDQVETEPRGTVDFSFAASIIAHQIGRDQQSRAEAIAASINRTGS